MNAPANSATVTDMRALQARPAEPDLQVDMFSQRGFELACRIAKAFATSDAVPSQFRSLTEKRSRNGSTWVENPAAIGNCIVAIETARAVGMSITAVMQQANVIEGRLSWSAQFVIAAINASGRFNPLRFQMRNLGRMKASYREKQGWNDAKKGYDFIDRTVEIDNVECIAWTLPRGMREPAFTPEQMRNNPLLELIRAAGFPVVESAPVSIKMAVEEGWYAKSGSKWQTELRTLMLQYRAGAFFGRIHAPDIVMGMGGRTSEELVDMTTVDVAQDGSVTSVTVDQLSRVGETPAAEVVSQVNEMGGDEETGEVPPPPPAAAARRSAAPAAAPAPPVFDLAAFIARINACTDLAMLQVMSDESEEIPAGPDRDAVDQALRKRDAELAPPPDDHTDQQRAQPEATSRRRGASRVSAE